MRDRVDYSSAAHGDLGAILLTEDEQGSHLQLAEALRSGHIILYFFDLAMVVESLTICATAPFRHGDLLRPVSAVGFNHGGIIKSTLPRRCHQYTPLVERVLLEEAETS